MKYQTDSISQIAAERIKISWRKILLSILSVIVIVMSIRMLPCMEDNPNYFTLIFFSVIGIVMLFYINFRIPLMPYPEKTEIITVRRKSKTGAYIEWHYYSNNGKAIEYIPDQSIRERLRLDIWLLKSWEDWSVQTFYDLPYEIQITPAEKNDQHICLNFKFSRPAADVPDLLTVMLKRNAKICPSDHLNNLACEIFTKMVGTSIQTIEEVNHEITALNEQLYQETGYTYTGLTLPYINSF